MNSSVEIRVEAARAEDDVLIESLARAEGLSVDAAKERQRDVARLWVARQKDENSWVFVGFLLFWVLPDEIEILDVAVLRHRRRQGIAATLLARGLELARAEEKRQAVLEVRASNVRAIALYRHLGFSPIDRRAGYYPGGEDALVFRCCLDPPR